MSIQKDLDTQSDVIRIFQRVMNQAFSPYRNRILITTDNMGTASPIPIGSSDHLVYYIADSVSKNRTRLGIAKEVTEYNVYKAIRELLAEADKVRPWYEKSSEEILGL